VEPARRTLTPGSERVRLYTRTGDKGETGLSAPGRVRKSSPRIEALGDLDEANAAIGAARVLTAGQAALDPLLEEVQHRLFDLGADLAAPGATGRLGEADVQGLEAAIDRLQAETPPIRAFVLPGGEPLAAALHLARTVARRAERALVRVQDSGEPVDPVAIAYLNRLSDLLFAAARWANRERGDVEWKADR
jgi:cob(I)alamin adenosyltransferase